MGWQQVTNFVEKDWGSELWMVNNKLYCGKILTLKKNYCCSRHYHKLKDETFYILEGKVLMETNRTIKTMNKGDVIHIPQKTIHRFTGIEDSKIIEISTEHFDSDSYRLIKGGKVKK